MSDPSSIKRDEAEMARERNENLQRVLGRKRLTNMAMAIVFAAFGALVWPAGLVTIAFCLIVVSLIFLVGYFDATGHLQEVRRRSTKLLAPNLSILRRGNQTADETQSQTPQAG